MYAVRRRHSSYGNGFPYLGQESAPPAGPGPARRIADLFAGSASAAKFSRKPREAGKLYPGRIVFSPSDPTALYVVSGRFAPARAPRGSIMLYAIEGPARGSWKPVTAAELERMRVVDEDEGVALRNLAPANRPPGNLDVIDVSHPIALLSNAAIALGTSFPLVDDIDAAKASAYYADGMDAVLLSIVMATEALDMAAAAYDTLGIGRNAYALIKSVGDQMLYRLDKIRDVLLQYEAVGLGAITKAAERIDAFMSHAPLWGLYLERAYLWTQLTDLVEMTRLREMLRAAGEDAAAALSVIDNRRADLLKEGLSAAEIDDARAYAEAIARVLREHGPAVNKGLQSYLDRNGFTYDQVRFAPILLSRFLDQNTEDIRRVISGTVPSAETAVFLSGLVLGVLGTSPTRGRTPQQLLEMMVKMRAGIRAGGTRLGKKYGDLKYEEYREFVLPHLEQFTKFMTESMRAVGKAVNVIKEGKGAEAKILDVVQALQRQLVELKARLEAEKAYAAAKRGGPDYGKAVEAVNKTLGQIKTVKRGLRIARTDSLLADANIIQRYQERIAEINQTLRDIKSAPFAATLPRGAEHVIEVLFSPTEYPFLTRITNPKEATKFTRALADFREAFDIDPNVMRLISELVADSIPSRPFTPTPKLISVPREQRTPEIEAVREKVLENIRGEITEQIRNRETTLKQLVGPEIIGEIRDFAYSTPRALGTRFLEKRIKKIEDEAGAAVAKLHKKIEATASDPSKFPFDRLVAELIRLAKEEERNVAQGKQRLASAIKARLYAATVVEALKDREMPGGATIREDATQIARAMDGIIRKANTAFKEHLSKEGLKEYLKWIELDKGFQTPESKWSSTAVNLRKKIRREDRLKKRELEELATDAKESKKENEARKEEAEEVLADPARTTEEAEAAIALRDDAANAGQKLESVLSETEALGERAVEGQPIPIPPSVLAKVEDAAKASDKAQKSATKLAFLRVFGKKLWGFLSGKLPERPTPAENATRQRLGPIKKMLESLNTKYPGRMRALRAIRNIAGLAGIGLALSYLFGGDDSEWTPADPKAPDAIPKGGTPIETYLKYGALAAGGGLLLYLIIRNLKAKEAPPKLKPKRA